ncbi:MAG: hypothetical protein D6784_08025 [Chloroflexi bacterium]|nr:MAG: hypothetical protein D6784_08025 [Chloroflexota bacterium]
MKVRTVLMVGLVGIWLWVGIPVWAQEGGQPYTIQHSDSLWKLAEKYLGDGNLYPLIVQATAKKAQADPSYAVIGDANLVHPGQKIWIPAQADTPTAEPAAPGAAAPAPAGKIAFAFWNPAPGRCTYEVNIIDVAACWRGPEECQAARRIFPLNNASEPALSPDGQRLAFRGWGAIPDELQPGQAHPYKDCAEPAAERWLQVATIDGTDVRSATGYFEDSHPDWSPDGQRVLFDTARIGDGISRIMFFYATGSGEEDLRIAGQQPSWAPDNDRFVYRGCDLTGNRCGLWLARAVPVKSWEAGANLLGPVLEEPEAAHPDWSPVGDEIVYQSPAGGSWDLYLIGADGTGKRRLTSDPAVEGLPAWSPDGRWIAYLSNAGGNWGIWVIPAAGGASRQIFAFDGGQFSPAAVEPYGVRDWLDEQISWSP